ncbi:MAG: GLUG motif-containing protein [Patescibacteria group bacterium]|nr:GLUG motif-containing protein [Patescibacteria group bacterium]
MWIIEKLKKYYILIGVFVVVSVIVGIVFAINSVDEGYQSTPSSSLQIDAHGVCKKVNNSGSNNITYFVPTQSPSEWTEFRESVDAGSLLDLTLEECGSIPEGIHITTCEELQMIGETAEALAETYILDNNIECRATKPGQPGHTGSIWDDGHGHGFSSIGGGNRLDGSMLVDVFTGSIDGQGYSIMNLYINRLGNFSTEDDLGLFGEIGSGVIIDDVHMTNIDYNGDSYVGGLVGKTSTTLAQPVEISDCSVQGSISTDGDYVGGLIGNMVDGDIADSSFTGNANGEDSVGGLVGSIKNGSITNCTVNGSTSISGDDRIGGLIGYTVYTSGIISVQGSTFTGSVSGEYSVGGIIGEMNGASTGAVITNCSVVGSNIIGEIGVGGLIGQEAGGITITNSSFTGNITATQVGGSGNPYDAGGLIGSSSFGSSIISNCHAQATIISKDNAGGLFGSGSATSSITDCYFSGDIKCSVGDDCDDFGGLVGHSAFDNISIDNCYASGAINGQGEEFSAAGGLVGDMYSGILNINNSYAHMDITSAEGYNYGGGLIGKPLSNWSVTNSYSIGSVNGFKYEGGIIGYIGFGSYNGSGIYWDESRSGLAVMCGYDPFNRCDNSVGRTTAQMRQQSNYSGWDFGSIWTINEGITYPYHR